MVSLKALVLFSVSVFSLNLFRSIPYPQGRGCYRGGNVLRRPKRTEGKIAVELMWIFSGQFLKLLINILVSPFPGSSVWGFTTLFEANLHILRVYSIIRHVWTHPVPVEIRIFGYTCTKYMYSQGSKFISSFIIKFIYFFLSEIVYISSSYICSSEFSLLLLLL